MKNSKLLSVLFISMIMLFASCGKDKEKKKDDPSPPIVEGGTVIKKYTFADMQYEYEYNSDSQLSKFKVRLVGSPDYTLVNFEYDGDKLLSYTANSGGEVAGKVKFMNHNVNDMPMRAEVYNGGGGPLELFQTFNFSYTGNNMTELLTMEVVSGQELIRTKNEYTYEGGNLIQQKTFDYNNSSYSLNKTLDFTYDNKNNPAYIFGFINFSETEIFMAMSVMDINNYVIVEISDASGTALPQESFNRVFEYNTDGFPTKCTMTSFDNGEEYIMKYEYY